MTNKSDIFDISRLSHLAAKDRHENRKKYLLSMLVMLGVLLILVYFIVTNKSRQREEEMICGMFTMFILGSIWASTAFKNMSTTKLRTATLMLPASTFEKFLLRWFIAIPMFLIAFCLFFSLTEETKFLIPSPTGVEPPIRISQLFNGEMATSRHTIFVIGFFLFIQSCFFLGSLLWQKIPAIKTFLCLCVIYGLYYYISSFFVITFMPGEPIPSTLGSIIIRQQKLTLTVIIILTLSNYVISYLKFKKSEIINHR